MIPENTTATTGPNGSIDWLNCGLESPGGWTPPNIKITDIVTVDLETVIDSGDSPFAACKQYLPLFKKHAEKNGLPIIMLTSFAMQESSCNKNTEGQGGEQVRILPSGRSIKLLTLQTLTGTDANH